MRIILDLSPDEIHRLLNGEFQLNQNDEAEANALLKTLAHAVLDTDESHAEANFLLDELAEKLRY
jgi:hypothetical protein